MNFEQQEKSERQFALNFALERNPLNAAVLAELKMLENKQLYVVYFESANYAGYGEHCMVWATDEDDALSNDAVSEFAEDFYREQDESQWYEENDYECDVWASIQSATKLTGSEFEEFVAKQPELYPIVN